MIVEILELLIYCDKYFTKNNINLFKLIGYDENLRINILNSN